MNIATTPRNLYQNWQFAIEVNGFDVALFQKSSLPKTEFEEVTFAPAGSLFAVYFILRDAVAYQELGANYFDQRQHDQLVKFHTKRLRDLGVEVQTGPVAMAA